MVTHINPAWLWLLASLLLALMPSLLVLRLRRRLLRNEARFAEREAGWIQALDFAEDAMYLVDLNDRLIQGNRKFYEFIRSTPEYAVGRNVMELIHGELENEPCPVCKARLEKRDAVFVKEPDDPMNRLKKPLEIAVRIRRDVNGDALGVLMVIRDLTRQRQAEDALLKSRERLRVVLESIGEAVVTTDVHGTVGYINPAAQALTGWSDTEARGMPVADLLPISSAGVRQAAASLIPNAFGQDTTLQSGKDCTLQTRNRGEVPVEFSAAPIRHAGGESVGVVVALRDVTEMRGMAKQLAHQASHDELTGLLNRRAFELRVQQAVQSARLDQKHHALCYLDLDQFKMVNDTCGHIAGDQLLKQLAVLLKNRLRENDVLARIGGDEFGVLMHDCPLPKACEIANHLRSLVRDFRFVWQEKRFDVGVSIGLAAITEMTADVAEILSAADSACYVAKNQGRNRIHIFEHNDVTLATHKLETGWVQRISEAMEADRLQLYAQKIVPLGPHPIVHERYEILIRMIDENGELVLPAAFIPAAERYHLMSDIDRWVVRTAITALQDWNTEEVVFAINISGTSLGDTGFLEFILMWIARSGVAARRLCFEITETAAVANFYQAREFIATLRDIGCGFALDDFGSGLSSFAYLKNLPVDYLKIDGNFVRNIAENPVDYALVKCIQEMGAVMGIKTVAESVDDPAILPKLRTLGIDYAQGYIVGRPMPLKEAQERRGLRQ